ncbi:hypothetical protein EXIGLDRAFT_32202 [Exidia glandulosa HHB12029]|uniref:Uncharacterized protein n=1 Tax=Exidia glandulosa HHB12029 TaxID=1314781 RepID=A0A166MVG3_EXIGL|nr:hypothetical protein EXIGLDRAFT_32202 [Exidia glandulosa HHB12029]
MPPTRFQPRANHSTPFPTTPAYITDCEVRTNLGDGMQTLLTLLSSVALRLVHDAASRPPRRYWNDQDEAPRTCHPSTATRKPRVQRRSAGQRGYADWMPLRRRHSSFLRARRLSVWPGWSSPAIALSCCVFTSRSGWVPATLSVQRDYRYKVLRPSFYYP